MSHACVVRAMSKACNTCVLRHMWQESHACIGRLRPLLCNTDLETQELVETAPFDPLVLLGGAPKRMEVLSCC